MKILLSAYACEPNRGSEPGVGWNWAHQIENLGHEVWVLTRENNRPAIDKYYEETSKPNGLNFLYYDVPKWLSWWKKGGRGVRLYYFLWQIGSFFKAKNIHKVIKFDKVHHITFGVVRQPSFMGKLGIPFILGPLGGGERAPVALRESYPFRGKILDLIRDVLNKVVCIDPFMLFTFRSATEIYVKTPESKNIIPSVFHSKTKVQIEIGIDPIKPKVGLSKVSHQKCIKLLYVGRFVYWKGAHLGLLAFKKLLREYPDAQLTMVGSGPEEAMWKSLIENEKKSLNWIPWVNQEQLQDIYASHDVLLFPSLHDSSGNVVLEAMAHGMPVICLNLGGPGVMIDNNCGIKVEVGGLSENQVVDELNKAVLFLANNPIERARLAEGAAAKANEMCWAAVVESIYKPTD